MKTMLQQTTKDRCGGYACRQMQAGHAVRPFGVRLVLLEKQCSDPTLAICWIDPGLSDPADGTRLLVVICLGLDFLVLPTTGEDMPGQYSVNHHRHMETNAGSSIEEAQRTESVFAYPDTIAFRSQ